jgi:hypothetical protein
METCSNLWGEDREQCFAIFGLDPRAGFWYSTVSRLEAALDLETEPEEEATHGGAEKC